MLKVYTTNNDNKVQHMIYITFVLVIVLLYSNSVAAKTISPISTTRRSIIIQPAFGLMRMASSSIDNNNEELITKSDNTNQVQGRTCAIVGVGVLGTSIFKQLLQSQHQSEHREEHQSLVYSKIYGITKTNNRHEQIMEQIMTTDDNTVLDKNSISNTVHLVTSDDDTDLQICDDVIFCAPPSGFTNYSNAIYESMNKYWKGSDNGGVFLFTSSGAIYGDASGTVTERTPIAYANADATIGAASVIPPRIQRLLDSESIVLQNNGTCIRLAGLYDLTRGAHNYWITSTAGSASLQSTSSTGIINLLHYDDAASCCIAVLKQQQQLIQNAKATDVTATLQKQIFLCSDNNPLSRYDICYYALQANVYKNYTMPQFSNTTSDTTTTTTTEKSKIYDPTYTMNTLQWQPKYTSFQDFMLSKI